MLLGGPGVSEAWVLIDDGLVERFGAALAWASRAGAGELAVLIEGDLPGGVVARRAGCFADPPSVWSVRGRSVCAAEPAPLLEEPPRAPEASGLLEPPASSLAESLGLEVVYEHGVPRWEVLGLEVARAVGDRVEVGVGRHDRSARAEMRPGEDLAGALAEAAAVVRSLRVAGAPAHPANLLARSRWLRSVACASPGTFGFEWLRPVAPPLPRFELTENGGAPCAGRSLSGAHAVVVCSTGVDLDLVPTAADCRLMHGQAGSELCLVVPEGDDLPITRELAGRLNPPARLIVAPRDWESLGA